MGGHASRRRDLVPGFIAAARAGCPTGRDRSLHRRGRFDTGARRPAGRTTTPQRVRRVAAREPDIRLAHASPSSDSAPRSRTAGAVSCFCRGHAPPPRRPAASWAGSSTPSKGTPIAGAVLEVVGTAIRAQSAIDGRYTLANVPAGSRAGAGPVHRLPAEGRGGIVVPAGGAVHPGYRPGGAGGRAGGDHRRGRRGTRARSTGRWRSNVTPPTWSARSPRNRSAGARTATPARRCSGSAASRSQDGKYVFVRGLGERYTTTSLNGARIPSPEPEKKVVPLDLFPAGLLEGITTSKTFTPGPAGRLQRRAGQSQDPGIPRAADGDLHDWRGTHHGGHRRGSRRGPRRTGREWLGFGGSARKLPVLVRQAGDLSGLTQAEANQVTAAFGTGGAPATARASPTAPSDSQSAARIRSWDSGSATSVR